MMHIPPYHKKRSVQIFFLGMFLGSIIAYALLAYMYGKMYENVITENIQLHSNLMEIEKRNEALLADKENLEEERSLTIQSVDIQFSNEENLRIDRLISHQLEDLIKSEVNQVIGREIDSVAENDDLLIRLIENKTFTIDDFSYQFEVEKLSITERIRLT